MIINLSPNPDAEAPYEVYITIVMKGSDDPNKKRNLHTNWTATSGAKRLRFSATVTTGPSTLPEENEQSKMHLGARLGIDFYDGEGPIAEGASEYVSMGSAAEVDYYADVPEKAIGFIAWFQVYRGIGNNEKGTAFFESPQIEFIYDKGEVAKIMP